ncbi:hypothetical protein BDV96DRAFT_582923 [Lophiotrema nucula]|uniref:FHA domain-containing protein n=1 Tax=Lophiotrema nucula TaxID=690887 RepID=A0A6A5YXH9_9PLEO|nr:hypothetical protein BDV96DRAFT_582923 [Lophiotrema nucula]
MAASNRQSALKLLHLYSLADDPPAASIEVVLKSTGGCDDFEERRIVLAPGDTVPIGRSSKNAHKKLLPAVDNGFIDSPVISREHAVLSAASDAIITVIDKRSMHGTLVNDRRLGPEEAYELRNGDLVQFGVNVIRDQESFIAKKFVFESTMLEPSRGSFRVPDTPDDEDIDEMVADDSSSKQEVTVPRSPRVPPYGTQSNPVNLEDFEDPDADITFVEESAAVLPPISNLIPEDELIASSDEDISDDDHDEMVVDGDFESEVSNEAVHSESSLEDDGDGDSSRGDASMDESDAASSIVEVEQSDEEVEDDLDALRRLKMEAMLNHEQQTTQNGGFTPPPEEPASAQPLRAENSNSGFVHSSPPAPFFQKVLQSQPMAPSLDFYNPFEVDSWENTSWAPPVPPRPSAPPKPSVWGPPGSEFAGPSMIRHGSTHNPWYEEPPSIIYPLTTPNLHNDVLPPYLAVSNNLRSTEEQDAPAVRPRTLDSETMKELKELAGSEDSSCQDQATTSSSVPTPPATVKDGSSPAQPARRTGLSIQEITETAPQPENPPTTTSMNSLKRKAEVFDEEDEAVVKEPTPTSETQVTPIVVVQRAEVRPRKRRFVSTALSYMATGVMGGAVAVGALMFIPEGFFA